MNSNLTRILVCFVFLLGVPARAQAPADDGQLQFRTLGWGVVADDLFYDLGGKNVPLVVKDAARSAFYSHPRTERLVFFRLVPGPEQKPVRQTVAEAEVGAAGEWPLLIFLQNEAGAALPYRVVALSDDLRSFPPSACRFINLTPVELRVVVGEDKFSLSPRAMHQINLGLDPAAPPQMRYAAIGLFNEQGARRLYGNNWAFRPNQRTLVVIFPQDGGMQLNRIVDDVRSYAAPAAASLPAAR